jgi:hypothetical protein
MEMKIEKVKDRINVGGVWYVRESLVNQKPPPADEDMSDFGQYIEYTPYQTSYKVIRADKGEEFGLQITAEYRDDDEPTLYICQNDSDFIKDAAMGSDLEDYSIEEDDDLVLFIRYLDSKGWVDKS